MKKKILIDARCIGGEGQGMRTYLQGMYNAIHEMYSDRYELFFAGFYRNAMLESFPFLDDAHFIELPQVGKMKLFSIVFPNVIKSYGIDFAHFQYVTPFVKNCKFIVTTHDVLFLDFPKEFSWTYRMKRKWLFKRALQKSEVRLTVSNYSKERINHWLDIPSKTIEVTPNAVASKFLKPYQKSSVQKEVNEKFGFQNYLLYVSRIEKRKNQQLLLKAYEDLGLAQKGIQLVFIGNDTLGEKNIAETINQAKKKYPGKVHWHSNVTEADLLKIYQAANLFVYPSLAEGFGIPPIEAAALGLNTLCSNQTAMSDFTFFGSQLVDPTDYPTFKEALSQLIKTNNNASIHNKNRSHIQKHYSWTHAAQVLHQQLETQQR